MLVLQSLLLIKLHPIAFSFVDQVAEYDFTCIKLFYLACKATMHFTLAIYEQWYLMVRQPCSNEISFTLT